MNYQLALKQFELDPVYTRKFRWLLTTGNPSIQVKHLARLMGVFTAANTTFVPLFDSFRIRHIEVSAVDGTNVALELLGASNSKGQEKSDTGTSTQPSRVVFSEKELQNSQAGWWWYQGFTSTTPLFSTATASTSAAYLDVVVDFTLGNGVLGPLTSTATGSSGQIAVNNMGGFMTAVTGFSALQLD